MIQKGIYKGIEAYIINTGRIEGTILPDYGGKLASLKNLSSGREFLFQSGKSNLEIPEYGASFSKYDSSGFDEVFPSIDKTFYPSGGKRGVVIPDHGEVWAMPWHCECSGEDELTMQVKGNALPYLLQKKVQFLDTHIHIGYELENESDEEMKFIWAAHCLLNCDHKTTRIIVPQHLQQVINVELQSAHLGAWGELYDYPLAKDVHGHVYDLSRFEARTVANCEKFYFTDPLLEGSCGVAYTDSREKLLFEFPVEKVPYLGIWKSQGGYRGDYNFALEPCTGVYDDVYLADRIGKVASVPAHKKYAWYLTMRIVS